MILFPAIALFLLSGLGVGVVAQTTANCNPLYTTCPPDPALGESISIDFTQGESDRIKPIYDAEGVSYTGNGLTMTIEKLGDGPTLASDFYIFFGKVEVVAQAAPGVGIVSAVVLMSDDNDEIDIEWLGGDPYHVQSNFFSKGEVGNYDRGAMSNVANPQSSFHTYTIDWNRDSTTWYIDGAVTRVLTASDAGVSGYPQTPMQIKIGSWVGGDPSNQPGTIAWAGGLTDFSQAPFTFYVSSLKVTDYSTGTEYVYGDNSGSADSIIVVGDSPGESTTQSISEPTATAEPTSTTDLATTPDPSTSTTSSSVTSSETEYSTSVPPSSSTSSGSWLAASSISSAESTTETSSSISSTTPISTLTTSVSFLAESASTLSTLTDSTISSPIPVHNMTSAAFISTLSTTVTTSSINSTSSRSATSRTGRAAASNATQTLAVQTANAAVSSKNLGSNMLSALLVAGLGLAAVTA
ncbi:concanavalin A-like lectin/glucanase domain-containing protein [Lipomyces kononenkoae]